MKTTLLNAGWKSSDEIWWKMPVTLTGMAHYFSLEEAYKLETTGDVYDYAVQALLDKMQTEDDFRRMN
jgi:hypothetical protein